MTDKINYIFNNGINTLFSSESTVITQSSTSGSDLSSNLNDNNLDTISKTEKGLGEFIDLSFNNPIDVSNLESLVIYTNNQISNPIVSKIRYETIGNVALDISEIQVWRDNSNILENIVSGSYQFNKIRFIRTSGSNYINISEIQVWINGVNVATSATVNSTGDNGHPSWGSKSRINDELNLDGSAGWHTTNTSIGNYIELVLSNTYAINVLESIVVYNRNGHEERIVGCSLQIYNGSTLNYTNEISVTTSIYRFDGPSISNVSSFSNTASTSQIISSSNSNVTIVESPSHTINVSSNTSSKNNLLDKNISTSYQSTQGSGQYIDLNISSTNLNDLQAIVIYNNTGSVNDLSNQKLTKLSLFDDSNVAIFEISNNANSQTDSSYNIIRYDGPKQDYYKKRIKNIKLQTNKHSFLDVNELQVWVDGTNIATSNTITQSSLLGSDISNNVIDSNLSTKSGTTRGLGEFFNVELSEPIDPESLESVVVYSDIDTSKNHFVKKLRFETTENYPLELNELQVWVGNSNLLQKNNFIYSWDFRVASSSSINDSKGGLTATYNGGMSSSINDGAMLDGTNDYISIPSFQLGGDPFTIETYFKLNSVKGFGRIFQFGHSDYDRLSLYRSFSTNNFGFNIKNGTTQVTYSGSGSITLSLNIWYHMVIVSNDTNLKVYINNVQAQESILSTTISRLSRIEHTLGANVFNGSPQEFNDMDMKLFRVWDGYALSSSEINLLYNNRESIQSDFPSNSYQSSTIYDLSYSYDNSFNTYASTSSGTGQFFDISFNGFDFNDLQAIVTYNYNTNFHNFYKNKIILYDDSDVPFIEYRNNNITLPNYNIFKFKGPNHDSSIPKFKKVRLETTDYSYFNLNELQVWIDNSNIAPQNNNISYSSGTTNSTNLNDSNLTTYALTEKGLGQFVELSLDQSYDVSSLQAVVAYSDNLGNVNSLISKFRIETTVESKLDISEIQVWYDHSNVAQVANSLSTMTDDSITTNYTSSIGKGQYIDVSFTPFNYDDLQAIVIYNNARSSLITPYYTFDASSYNFNGSGSNNTVAGLMIDMPGFVNLTGNSPKTIEAYLSTTDTSPQFAVQLGEIATNKAFALRTMSGKLSFMGFSNDVNSDISINDGNVHRVAISYDGNVTLKFFSDNTVETKTLAYQLNTGSTDAKVGAMNHSNRNYWNGTIGKVNIYNTFISSFDEVGENEINDLSDVKFTFYDDSNIELFTVDSSASSSLKTFSNNVSTFNDVNIYKYKGKEYSSSISKISKIRFVTTGDNILSINEAQLWVGSPITTWSSTSYSQLGQTITGNAGNDRIFSTMGMSSDGLKLVSANQLDPTTDSRGTIQAYSFNGNAWVTYGSLIEAQASEVGESAYSSIADMTDDGTRIFIGYRQIGSNTPDTKGFAQVYDYVNGDWSQVGNNIQGDNTGDNATRVGVISGDGTTIAHMGGYTNTASTRYCQVRRYQSSTNTWNQIGSNIAVALTNKNADKTDCLAISQNGNIVAIGSNKDGTSSQGAVRIYQYNSSTNSWSQLGSTLLGENANDEFGISLSMSDDGTVIIVGSWKADDTGGNDGNARVFEYSNNSWTQVGNNIIPNTSDNNPSYFGNTVRVSGNGKFFAVSGYQSRNPAGQQQSGETRVYIREGNTFTQIINTIYGQTQDFFGSQIFLNTDGTILAVGSGGFNAAELHPMKLYQLSHSYNNSYSSTNVLSDSNNIVTQSSTLGSDVSSQVNDTNFGTLARTERRNGEFIDISLNSLYDVSNLQGLVVYSSINNDTNPTISKIRYQTTSNVKLKIGEFQVWVDNSNIASQINNVASSTSGTQVIGNLNDSNLYTYASTNQGEGEYFDINLNNSFNYNDLEAIVTYTDETAGDLINQRSTKLILYDESNTPVIELSNNLMESGYVVNNSYTGPIPKYSFDFRNGSTITNDQISNVVATAYNGVTFNSNGASLNGSNQYIESTSSMSISGEVSFEFYIQFTPQGTSDPGVIYVISDDNDGLSIFNMNQSYTETPQGYNGNTNAHQLNMVLSNAQGVGSDSFDPRFNNMSNLINSGTMTHVVITFDSAGFRTYKNGSLHQTQGSTAANVSSKLRKLRLGVGTNSVYSLMTIKYIRIYDNALTTSQASTMYSLRESTNLTVPGMVSLTTPYKIFKYIGPSHKLNRSKLSHFKIETTNYSQLNINEIQYFTDGNNLFQTDKPVLTSTTTFGNISFRVARIRRAIDNVEADFYNVNNEGLKTIDGTTISSWMSSLPTPTYNWDFRVSSSTINNDSISGLTATYMNGLTSTVENGAYFAGGGASNGNFNYIDLQDFNLGGTCSFETYVRFEGNNNYEKIFDFNNGHHSYTILLSRSGTTSNFNFTVRENSVSYIEAGTIVNGQFTHIVATINSTDNNIKLYQDGSLIGSLSTSDIPSERVRTNHHLGRSNVNTDTMFNGYIKYLRVWQGTELSSSDVTNLYNARETANNFVGYLTKLYSQSSTTTTDLVQPTTSKQPKITLSSLEMIFSGGQDIYAETPTNMLNTNQDYFSFALTFNHQSESNHGEMGFWPTVGTYNQGGSISFYGQQASGNRTYIGFEGYDNGTYGTSGTIVDINTEYNFVMTINNSVSNNVLSWANNSTTTPTTTAASSGNGGNNTTHSLNPNNFYLGSRRSTGVFYIGTLKSFIVLNKTLSTTEAASFNSTSNYTSNNTPWIDSNNLTSSATGIFSLYNLRTNSNSSKLFDSNLSSYLITEKGLGQSLDLSFNTAQDLSKIDGIVFYSDVRNDYNPLINKVRIETIDNVKLYYNEIQIWTGTTNILNTISTSNVLSSSSTNLSNLYDQSLGSYYESNQGVGEYIDFVLNNSYYLNDIKSIITYSKNSSLQTLQDLKNIKLTLFDDSNVPFIELSGNEITTSNDSLIVKYNGPNYETNIQKLKSVKFETTVDSRMNFNEIQLWSSTSQYNLFERFRSIDAQYGTLTATRSVTMPGNYNGNLMNFPQSIFNGGMGSNTKTVSGLTGDLSIFNGTYSITWSSRHTVPYSTNRAHYMFSATNSTNQYGDNYSAQFRYTNNNVPYNSSGYYTGNNYITYQDDNGNSINASGEWFAFEFPAYINFTKVHHIGLDGFVKNFTWIGRDINGINRLLGTYSMNWSNGNWKSRTFNNNYFVNKIYLVITRKQSGLEYMLVHEIFFDGNYELSPAQISYPNNTTVATTPSVSVNDVSNMFDRSFNTNFSFDKGLGNFVDISLNDPIDLSSVQSIVAYSSINNTYNPIISKIRYETTANVALEANEIQVWRDNSNIIPSPNVTLNYTGSETLLTYTNLHSSMTGVFSVKFGADGIVYGVTGKQLYKNIFTTPSLIYTWGQDWYFNDFNVDKYGNVYIGDSNPGYRGLSKLTYNSASDSYSSPVTLHDNHPNPGYYGSYSVYYIGYEATARIYYEHPLIYLVTSRKNISSYNVDTNTTVHQRNYGEPNNDSLKQGGRLSGLAHDSQGNIFVSNWENGSVVLVYKAGTIFGSSVDYDGNPWIVDNLYTITGSNHLGSSTTRNSSPDFFTQDGQHVKFSTHYYCSGLMIDSNDDMYFTSYRDNYRMVLVKVSGATGIATRLVGDGNHSGGLSWTDGAQINQLYSQWTWRHQYYGPFFTIDSQDTLWLKNGNLLFKVPRSIIPSVSSTSGSNLSYLYDGNLNTYFNTNQGIGEYIDLNLRSTNFNDIQSIIFYNNGDSGNDLSNQNATKLILYDDNNLPVVEYINNVQSGSYKYFKYKGPAGYNEDVIIPKLQNIRIDTTEYVPLLINELQLWVSGNNVIPTQGIITQSSTYSSDVSSNISDSNLNTYARTDRGLGEYIDVSFSDPIPIQDVESLVLYSNNTNYNPLLNKIRFITNDNVKIELDKVQLWTDYSNILQETNYLSNQGIGEYIDISTNLIRYDDIQEIIAYVGNSNVDLSNFDKTKLQFYDSSNILFAEINNFSGQTYSGTYDWDFRISTPSISHTPLITPTYNWDFRVASSTSVTDSVGGLTATYEGGATSDTTNGVLLDGVNDFIDLDNFEFGGVCSWEVYFKFETLKNQTVIVQFSHTGYTSFSENDIFLFYTTSNNYYNSIRNNGSNTAVFGNQAMGNTDTNWNHVIWTFNNGTHVQYLNGVKKLEITGIPMRTITRNHHILGNYFDTAYMHGYIKYFRVYQGTALTQSQVTELYNTRDGVISITDSVGGLSATYMNGTTSDTTNGALFDGINNYIELEDFEFGGVCSFEVYYKFITQKNGNVVVQFSDTGRTTATENDLIMLQGGTTNYYNSIRNNGSNTSVFGNGAMGTTNTNWNHVVWTFNNGTHKQYLNGVEKLTTTGVPMRTIIRAHHMLGNKYDSIYMNGYIKYFRIYQDLELDANTVTNLFNNRESSQPNLLIKNIRKYKGNSSSARQLSKIRIESLDDNQLNIEELQLWVNNENHLYTPTHSTFILTGDTRSLTDVHGTSVLTLINSPTFDTNGVTPSDNTKYITIPTSLTNFGSNDFTISFWYEPLSDVTGYNHIFSMPWNDITGDFLISQISTTREFVLIQRTTSNINHNLGIISTANTLYNFIITRKNNFIKVFINGEEKTSVSYNGSLNNRTFMLGASSTSPNASGFLNASRIFKRLDIWNGTGFSN